MRRRLGILFSSAFLALSATAEIQIIDGVAYECKDGLCRPVAGGTGSVAGESSPSSAGASEMRPSRCTGAPPSRCTMVGRHLRCRRAEPSEFLSPSRVAQGYMDADAFLAFLRGDPSAGPSLPTSAGLLVLALLLAGIAMNLTPCVLPMVPVNLVVIGKSATRGALYGLGLALAYGTLGAFAAFGGLAFGTIQASPFFNGFVALVFVTLGLALCGVRTIDFSRGRSSSVVALLRRGGLLFPFLMGVLGAVLAGACVAPVLISVLVLTADLSAQGNRFAWLLPFVLGAGMGLPWPFLGAGLKVLPAPGAWMRWVSRGFALVVFAFAAWYAALAVRGLARGKPGVRGGIGDAALPVNGEEGRDALPGVRGGIGDAALPVNGGETCVVDVDLASLESLASLEPLLSPARHGKPVLVDCWASWCKSCAAMERGTLRDARVAEALKGFAVIRLRAEDLSALTRLPGFGEIRGLPAFVVFGGR